MTTSHSGTPSAAFLFLHSSRTTWPSSPGRRCRSATAPTKSGSAPGSQPRTLFCVADAGTALSLYLTTERRALRAFKAVPLPNMPNKAAARTTKSANMEHFIVYDYVLTNCNLHAYGNCYMLAVQDDDDQPLSKRWLLAAPISSSGNVRIHVVTCRRRVVLGCPHHCPACCQRPLQGAHDCAVIDAASAQAHAVVSRTASTSANVADRSQKSQYTSESTMLHTALAWPVHSSCHGQQPRRRPPLRLAHIEDEVPRGGAVPPLLRNKTPVEAVWTVAWPSVAIGLLRTALGQTDAWYIGRLGKKELEAMGAASFGVWLVYLLGEVGAVGVQALASESEGAGDRKGVEGGRAGLVFLPHLRIIILVIFEQKALDAYFDVLKVTDATVRNTRRRTCEQPRGMACSRCAPTRSRSPGSRGWARRGRRCRSPRSPSC